MATMVVMDGSAFVDATGHQACRTKQLARWYRAPTPLQKAAHEVVLGTDAAAKSSS